MAREEKSIFIQRFVLRLTERINHYIASCRFYLCIELCELFWVLRFELLPVLQTMASIILSPKARRVTLSLLGSISSILGAVFSIHQYIVEEAGGYSDIMFVFALTATVLTIWIAVNAIIKNKEKKDSETFDEHEMKLIKNSHNKLELE